MIRVRNELGVSHVLGDFFVAAMEIANVGNRLRDNFAVEFEHDAQNAVRRRMRRPHVQDHFLGLHVGQIFIRRTDGRRINRLRCRNTRCGIFKFDVLRLFHRGENSYSEEFNNPSIRPALNFQSSGILSVQPSPKPFL